MSNDRLASLRKTWAAFQARAPREKALLLGALLALTLMAGDALFTAPAWAARKAARQRSEQGAQALAELRQAVEQQAKEREQVRQQQQSERLQLNDQLQQLQANSPAPLDGPRTLALLETLVARQQGRVQLIGMTALPDPVASIVPAAGASAPTALPLYRHGLQLVVSGGYADLNSYLRGLAEEPQLRVRGFQLAVREHPQLELKLELETLSPQAAWLTL
jgi:type II secretory pathway component PulM